MKKISIMLLATASFLQACKPTVDPEKPGSGTADFSTYVAVGNSLTAGYADGTLYRSGQENSYPAMLAAQFKLAGGGEFTQPLLPGNAGYPDIKLVLGYATDCLGNTSLGPVPYAGNIDTAGSGINISGQGPFNNVGVPGIRCIDYALPGYAAIAAANGAPWAARFYPNPGANTPMEVALLKPATFFSVWLGANDVLGYATAGGGNTAPGIFPYNISPLSTFKSTYDLLISKLTADGAKGVLINIPDVTSIPFFTTIDRNGLVLNAAQAQQLSAAYAPLGITFHEGANPFIIADATATGGLRQIKDGEYILLTTPGDSLKCGGWGSTQPIPAEYVLTADEVAAIQSATEQFNEVIANDADQYHLGLVDANNYMKTLQKGVQWNGLTFTPEFVTGGAFSLDGIHLTPRGYALFANEVIRVINATYDATIPQVEVTRYNGILFPG